MTKRNARELDSAITEDGSVLLPTHSFDTDTDTGFYHSAANTVSFTAGGSHVLDISSSGIALNKVSVDAGTAAAPSITFTADSNTGLYNIGADQLAVAAGGAEVMYIANAGVSVPNGTSTAPGLNFLGDSNTGLYSVAADQIGFAAGGSQIGTLSPSGIFLPVGGVSFLTDTNTSITNSAADTISLNCGGVNCAKVSGIGIGIINGSAVSPSLQFNSDTTTGLYRSSAGVVGIACSTIDSALISANQVLIRPGTAAVPSLSFIGDTNTGFYNSAADMIGVALAGSAWGTLSIFGITTPAGSAANPSHSFTGDANSGIYSVGADQVGISCGGSNVGTFSSTGLSLPGTISASNIASGTYSPTISNSTNLDSSTLRHAMYHRIGDIVTVFIRIELDPTAASTECHLDFTLPVARTAGNFSALSQVGGVGQIGNSAGSSYVGVFDAIAATQTVRAYLYTSLTAATETHLTFWYSLSS